MKTCPVCHIELTPEAQRCPLCGHSFEEGEYGTPGRGPAMPADANEGGVAAGPRRRKAGSSKKPSPLGRGPRFWIWEVQTLVAFAAIVVVLAADLASGFSVTWSIYPLAALGWLWLSVTAATFLRRRLLFVAIAETALLLVFLAVLDLIVPGRPWFFPVALPIALFSGMGAAILVLRRKRAVLSNYAIALALIGVLLGIIEMAVSRYATGVVTLSWSILTFGCLLPIIVLLLYIQHRIKHRSEELRKYFHV